ncbi:MAG: bifunctional folylpolyglutamate synthase/dihydrofolate synthase [Aquificae bacterium]|nr:bifunctional folylpolyglutamate synthase/dihydrofolate synthase [Aquificota bacterium]
MKLYSLFQKKEFFINPGLERIKKASKAFGNPHSTFKSVLISGTNGKGSTAVFLESLFRHHNLKTGLFTSPHLLKENERWQINRREISDEKLEFYISQIKPVIDRYNLTYFEACTLLAFLYFRDEKVDIGVFEVGLGGRWDSTNILEPEFSIITNVSLDHTHLLGDTLRQIAEEKLGIARKDKPLILGSNQKELLELAQKKQIKPILAYKKDFDIKIKSTNPIVFDYRFKEIVQNDLSISMLGRYQAINSATALTGFLSYWRKYDIEKVKKALKDSYWLGRLQVLSDNPIVIVDGAHNEDAVKKSFQELKDMYPNKKITTIYSAMKDKKYKKMLNIIKNYSDRLILTKMPVSRTIDREDILGITEVEYIDSIEKALKTGLDGIDSDTILFVTGSLYLVGEVLKLMQK